MNKPFISGILLSATLGIACIPLAMHYMKAFATRDINLGEIACKAETVVVLHGGIPYGAAVPRCEGDFSKKVVIGYSFTQQTKAESGDPLVCTLVQHNDLYFVWDRRGQGYFNDPTYSIEDCRVGRQA